MMAFQHSLRRPSTLKVLGAVLLFIPWSPCVPVEQEPKRTAARERLRLQATVAFLEKYGYLEPGPPEELSLAQVKEAVRKFQWISHLPVSGALDEPTVQQMMEPRCGVKDIGSQRAWQEHVENLFLGRATRQSRTKRYLQQGEKWYKHHLTYKIINWPRYLEQSRVKLAVRTAFELWSNASPLTFWEVMDGPADIRLAFYQGEHNDGIGNAFDGPGGALAHAFFPRRGEAHFDNDERWSLNRGKGRNLFIVTAHEIGHTLGLEHSPVKNALMSPFYKKLGRDFILSWDDKMAIQKLYGEPRHDSMQQLPGELFTFFQNPAEHATTGIPSDSRLPPSYCRTHFDTLTKDLKQNIYIFRGADYWKLSKDGNIKGPLSLQKSWPELPSAIEAAAVSDKEGKFYFFRGGRCWRYAGNRLDKGFPMKVKDMGLPRHPDAAFYFRPLSHVVIFKGSKYYVLNEELMQVEQYYPRTLSDWKGIPIGINGVFTWNEKRTYFFKDETYWKFDHSRLKALHQGKWAKELEWAGCSRRNGTEPGTLQT
ncbi:matrix metalloproteinase-28 [Stegostoma tigrinum]|uniref:matrix metalloproteinase-28 n=1 Tax=Stegostoma tigrinum TaxID=3053191 RepID=UPI00287073FF|nr:matrix metalloproteinase-28 [Stegostoma tigrinum]